MEKLRRADIVPVDLAQNLPRSGAGTLIALGDQYANRFGAKLTRHGNAVDTDGYKVLGFFIRPDGRTVTIDGAASGDEVYVDLMPECYAYEGRFSLSIKIIGGDIACTVRVIDGYAKITRTDEVVDPGSVIPSFESVFTEDAVGNAVEAYLNKHPIGGGTGAPAIPEYVETEAMSVLDKVIAAQGSRTFTLMAITDMHYGSSDYIDGVIHAAQGMRHIKDRIKIDAVAVLGDYTDEHQMDTDTAVHDLEEVNALLDPLRTEPNLRLKGNHDHRPGEDAEIYRYIMAYSEDVVWGSRLGGYFYRDFEAYKLRVVCLNTTEVARSNLSVSDAQYQWFAGALDLSGKADAASWGILILSHHPVDFTVTDGAYRFGPIINAYEQGAAWTDGTISCDYTGGRNAAALIGNIHGHLHNLLTAKIYKGTPGSSDQTGVWRMCTPASRVDYVNHYSAPWQEAQWWEKTKYTADDTSFVVYCIDLDAKTIKAYCYGAGYDRSVNYTGGGDTGGGESGGGDTPAVDNWLPVSTDINGNVYNGTGWKANTRYSASSNAESAYDGIYLSGYIPVAQGNVVTLENVGLATTGDSARVNVVVFGTDKASAWEAANVETLLSRFGAVLADDSVTVKQFTIPDEGTKYIRINATYLGDDSVVRVQ